MRLFLLLLLCSLNAWANPACNNKARITGSFYSNFMNTQHSLQHRYVGYYQGVSDKFDEGLKSACKKNSQFQETIQEIQDSCIKACDQGASSFFIGLLDNTKKKQKLLFNECATLCNVTTGTMHMMGNLNDDSNCTLGKTPLDVDDTNSVKDIVDVIHKKGKPSPGATPK